MKRTLSGVKTAPVHYMWCEYTDLRPESATGSDLILALGNALAQGPQSGAQTIVFRAVYCLV